LRCFDEVMQPPKQAERIVFDVSSRIEVDRDRLRAVIGERFKADAEGNDLIEAERIASEVVDDAWGELSLDCDQALADVRELYLVQAARVLEAQQDLHEHGAESWIARAVMHQQAFQLAWDVLDERGLLTELE
jgi:hypothetical protein